MPNTIDVKSIPQISLSSDAAEFTNGLFEGQTIKALNMTMGIGGQPTSFSVGLITENGRYNDYSSRLSYLVPYFLKIGNASFVVYLIKSNKDISTDQRTIQLTFVDGSHILDRVFVGLVGTHTMHPAAFHNELQQFTIPVTCAPCQLSAGAFLDESAQFVVNVTSSALNPQPPNTFAMPPIFTTRNLKVSNLNGWGNNQEGGIMYVGNEKFSQTDCDLHEVDYSFEELRIAAAGMGIPTNLG